MTESLFEDGNSWWKTAFEAILMESGMQQVSFNLKFEH